MKMTTDLLISSLLMSVEAVNAKRSTHEEDAWTKTPRWEHMAACRRHIAKATAETDDALYAARHYGFAIARLAMCYTC